MSTLSHTTKVAIRRALKALRTMDEKHQQLENKGYQIVTVPANQIISSKAGFRNRTDLENFARKHHLL